MLLIAGILLWSALHLSKSMAPQWRQSAVAGIGEGPYKGLFSLAVLGALALIVIGWRSWPPTSLYLPPAPMRHVTMLLVPLALVLFFAARIPTDLRRLVRHPQLTGLKLWAFAHLLANGETRSLVLFGGLLAWAVLEVIFINRRDGAWHKPEPVGPARSALQVVIALAISAGIVYIHPWLAGVPLLPR